jgi:hypothetical protein
VIGSRGLRLETADREGWLHGSNEASGFEGWEAGLLPSSEDARLVRTVAGGILSAREGGVSGLVSAG